MTRAEAIELQPHPPALYWGQIGVAVLFLVTTFLLKPLPPLWICILVALLGVLYIAQAIERLAFPIYAAQRSASFSDRAKSRLRTATLVAAVFTLVFFILAIVLRSHRHSDFSQLAWMLFFMNYFFADLRGETAYKEQPARSSHSAIAPHCTVLLQSEHWGNR